MASVLEKRLDRVEAAVESANEGPGIVYCRTDSDAEQVWSEAKAAGRTSPMCIVNGHLSDPAVIEGPTMSELLANVEAHGRRIYDPLPDGYTYKDDGSYLWRPPINAGRG